MMANDGNQGDCWKYLARDNQLALHEIFMII